jgi:PAS domain S-box-containing protein
MAALQTREEQYRAIFDGSSDAMGLWDHQLRLVDVNSVFVRIGGYTREQVVGQRLLERPGEPEADRRTELLCAALAGREGRIELQVPARDGSAMDVEVSYVPVRFGGESYALSVARDITERRERERALRRSEAQLLQAQKMEAIGQLTGGIAHDFNNILTSVIGYVAMSQERAEAIGDPTLVRQLGQAQLAAQRARDLIGQMLAFARRQRGERHVVALEPLVRQTMQLLRATLPASVVLDASPLCDGTDPRVDADPVQLEQVLFNLCINARDAIQGPGTIRVRLREDHGGWSCASCRARVEGGHWIALRVADSGNGIDPQAVERIFEPFFSTKEVGRGSGMGLAIVHGIVHDHGGHIEVRTRPGKGSVFRVLLPPASAPQEPPPHVGGAIAAAATPDLPGGRVMVVEDEVMVGDLMVELLGGWGLQVVLQRDPVQAAAWLDDPANRLDLLITDHTMPHMTGLALAERVHGIRPGLPVLLYTGNADAVDAADARRHGVRTVLRKPIELQSLRVLLRRLLSERRGVDVV